MFLRTCAIHERRRVKARHAIIVTHSLEQIHRQQFLASDSIDIAARDLG